MKFTALFAVCFLALLTGSCSSSKTSLPYFTDIASIKEGTLPQSDYMPKIKPDDELFISVNSLNPEATAAYNLGLSNPATVTLLPNTTTPSQQTYVVTSQGNINFPLLGTLHVAGMTTEELAQDLVKRISVNVEDPNVIVQLINFKVNVAGEVQRPGTVNVKRNRMTILDALSEVGDLTEYGERSNVLVIREENGERKFAHLDLNSSDLLNSPYYYLQQNDYIYVEPNKVRQENSKYNTNNSYKLSLTSTIVSTASVIASLVIALTVK